MRARRSDLAVEVVDTAAGLDRLRPAWRLLEATCGRPNPFLTWDWQTSWWETFGASYQPLQLLVSSSGQQIGLVPLCATKADPRRLLFGGGLTLSDQLGFLHLPGRQREVAAATLDWAAGRLPRGGVLDLHYLPESSSCLSALREESAARRLATEDRVEEVSPGLDLPSDFERYLGERLNKKDRHELRRKFRRLDQERPGWRLVSQADLGVDAALREFLRLLRASGAHKAEFLTAEVERFFGLISGRLEERGWLRIQLLESRGELLAAAFGFTVAGTWNLYNSGYDPEHASLSPGLLCVAEGIRAAIVEGCDKADLLRGNEPYKYRLGAVDQALHGLSIGVGPAEGGA